MRPASASTAASAAAAVLLLLMQWKEHWLEERQEPACSFVRATSQRQQQYLPAAFCAPATALLSAAACYSTDATTAEQQHCMPNAGYRWMDGLLKSWMMMPVFLFHCSFVLMRRGGLLLSGEAAE